MQQTHAMRIARDFLAASLAWMLAVGCQAQSPNKPVELATFDYPPFMEMSDDHPSGIITEIITEAFRRMHAPVRIALYPLGRTLLMVDTGEIDGMFTAKKTPDRTATYTFSKEPLLTQEYVIFVAADSKLKFTGNLAELSNLRIGVVRDTSYGSRFDTAVRNGTLRPPDSTLTHESNFKKLLLHHVDAVVCSKVVGLSILKRLSAGQQAKIIGPTLDTTQSYVIFGKQVSPALVRSFDDTVASLRADGTIDRIFDKYTR